MASKHGDLEVLAGAADGDRGVVIVAKESATRARLSNLLTAEGITVVAKAATPDRVVKLCANDSQLVVVLSCDPVAAPASIRALKEAAGETRIVLVTEEATKGRAFRAAVSAQAEAVVYGDRLEDALAPSVRAVFAEQMVFPRSERRRMNAPVLSHRERQVLRLAVQGLTNGEIAMRLYLATSTVKGHLTSAFAKLAVGSRSEAAALIFDPDEPIGRTLLAGPGDGVEAQPWS